MKRQVDRSHYTFSQYSSPARWVSYYHQIREVLAFRPESVLEVGVGECVLRDYLLSHTSIRYASLDLAGDLEPDIIGDIGHMPCSQGSVDVVAAFQVLEHLPFDRLPLALEEMRRVSRLGAVISLPHFRTPIKLSLAIPRLPEIRLRFQLPHAPAHTFDGEHHWEIGKKGYSLGKVRERIEDHFRISREFTPFENLYHHFFVLSHAPERSP